MRYFKVFLNGENFWLHAEGKPTRLGFFTTRFVEAESETEAELRAVEMLRADPKLQGALNDHLDPPTIQCEKIEETDAFHSETVVQHGLTLYPEGTDV